MVSTTSGSGGSAYGFTGEYQSQGLVYLRARMYAPAMGRFLTRDTWGGNANRPMSFNRWNYTGENPVNRIDPSGLSWISDLFGLNFIGGWVNVDRNASETAAVLIGYRLLQTRHLSSWENYPNTEEGNRSRIYDAAQVFRNVYGINNDQLLKLDFQGLECSLCRSQACQDAECWEDITYIDKDGKIKYKNIPGTDIPAACKPKGAVTYTEHEIQIASLWPNYNTHGDYWKYIRKINNMIHEFGHAFNQRANGAPRIAVSSYSETVMVKGKPVDFVMNKRPLGFYTDTHGSMTWVQSGDDATTGEASPGSEVFRRYVHRMDVSKMG
jgi:RHS repeat-associated protein